MTLMPLFFRCDGCSLLLLWCDDLGYGHLYQDTINL